MRTPQVHSHLLGATATIIDCKGLTIDEVGADDDSVVPLPSTSLDKCLRDLPLFSALKLSFQRTLRDYLHFTGATTGFSCDIDKQLMDAAKIDTCPKREKAVVILMDEMHVKEDLVFNKPTGTGIY